jgi:type IV secretory pathway VirB10-like protein
MSTYLFNRGLGVEMEADDPTAWGPAVGVSPSNYYAVVKRDAIRTSGQAWTYGKNGAIAAARVCPHAVAAYSAAEVRAEQELGNDDAATINMLKGMLKSADETCGKPPAPAPPPKPPPSQDKPVPKPPKPPGVKKADTNWLLWGGLAFVGVMLLKKKKKGSKRNPYSTRTGKKLSKAQTMRHFTKERLWMMLTTVQRELILDRYGSFRAAPKRALVNMLF